MIYVTFFSYEIVCMHSTACIYIIEHRSFQTSSTFILLAQDRTQNYHHGAGLGALAAIFIIAESGRENEDILTTIVV